MGQVIKMSLNKILYEKNMFLRHFRRFERCSYHLIEPVTTYREEVCEDKEWSCVTTNDHPSNLRMGRKQNSLLVYISLMFPKLLVQLYNN